MGLGLALRYVLDAVKKPPGSKMYYFGVVALDRFRGRLREYPQYCQHLATVEHFKQFPPHLIQVRPGDAGCCTSGTGMWIVQWAQFALEVSHGHFANSIVRA